MQNKTINGYTLLQFLGEGGMAEVWYAENRLGKSAAIKLMLPKFIQYPEVIARFEIEAIAMVKLDHPNIRQVMDYGEFEDRPFIMMEYLEGKDLSDFMEQGNKPNEEQLENWWHQCLSALQHTHENGIIHRDIKPSNLFLQNNGNIKILDFGIAKVKDEVSHTRTGQDLGTVWFMSPEQVINPKTVTSATDIYSLGVSFAHIIKGEPIFANTDSAFSVQMQITQGQLNLDGIPSHWKERLDSLVELKPDNRPTAKSLLLDEAKITATNDTNKTKIISETIVVEDPIKVKPVLVSADKGIPKVKNSKKHIWIIISCITFVALAITSWFVTIGGGCSSAKQNIYGYYAIYDDYGKRVTDFKYDDAHCVNESLAAVKLNEKWGFIDIRGTEVIPFKYEEAGNFHEGLADVELDGKWGFIDKSDRVIILLNYDDVGIFSEGLAFVKLNGKYGFINKSGYIVIPIKYDEAFSFSEDMAEVAINGKVFHINKKGECVKDCP